MLRTEEIQLRHKESNSHFQDIRKYETIVNLFAVSLDVNVETIPAELQIELVDLQRGYGREKYISACLTPRIYKLYFFFPWLHSPV
jgi:hypothetical protein